MSVAEKSFVVDGINNNLRIDGRQNLSSTSAALETGIIQQSYGSCRVQKRHGSSVLVGIKAQVSDQSQKSEEEDEFLGSVLVHVECSPSAFLHMDPKQVDQKMTEISQMLTRILNTAQGGLDLSSLVIIPNQISWQLTIEVLIIEYLGNVLDCCMMAVRGALMDCRIPRVIVQETDGSFDFDLDEDHLVPLKGVEHVPLSVTVNLIGSQHVVDCTVLEEQCSSAQLCVFVNDREQVCAMQKLGMGKMNPSALIEMTQIGKQVGTEWIKDMNDFLSREHPKHGFF
ncbi:ribosomal protein S5 domain 2-type protein [Gorgonomyces haynaldii]|nr:ribosomal protein S5 domain 2-type protein [Gorgonomyces haynaldii]